jgi:hypothetical protein
VKRILVAFAILGVLTLFTLLSACGDDDNTDNTSPTPITSVIPDEKLEPYFERLDAIFEKASEDTAEANQELNDGLREAGTDLDEEKAAMSTFLTATEAVFDNAIAAMNDLDVPSQAKNDHDSFVAAAEGSALLASTLEDDLADAKSDAEAQALIDEFNTNYQPLLESADQACTNLQDLATAAGLDTDLACQG